MLTLFQNEQVGRIANPSFEDIVLKSCETINEEQLLNTININQINDSHLHTLVAFNNVQFTEIALGQRFYESSIDISGGTNHLIQDATGTSLVFRTSAFADFARLKVPDRNGSIRGVLTKFKGVYQLMPRTIEDINLNQERMRVGFTDTITGAQITIDNLRKLFNGSDTTIADDIFIEGIVTLSGFQTNNIPNLNTFIQDDTGAISLSLSETNSLEAGMLVKVHLKDVLLNESNGLLQALVTQSRDILFVDENQMSPNPSIINIEDLLSDAFQSQLVQINDIQFENEIGTYNGSQVLTDCINTASLITNSNASFSNNLYPTGNGTIVGIAT